MWKPDICIYHGNCDDGFGAAWAIWKRWPDIEFVPGVYGKPLPDVAGKNVLFVDFSAKRPEIEAMAKVAKTILIIDHHKTAEADLEPFKINLCSTARLCPRIWSAPLRLAERSTGRRFRLVRHEPIRCRDGMGLRARHPAQRSATYHAGPDRRSRPLALRLWRSHKAILRCAAHLSDGLRDVGPDCARPEALITRAW